MTDVRLLFPADYLGAPHLRGRDVTLTISRVFVDDLKTDRGSEKKPVVQFEELDRKRRAGEANPYKWVLNRTCAKVVAKLYGPETDDWVGKRITLFATTCQAFGQTVDCIRVRETAPPAPRGKRQPEPEPADDAGIFDDEEAAQ